MTNTSTTFLTKEDILAKCPVAFAKTPTNGNVSSKYLHVNTGTIIEDLAKLGWLPVQASQRKNRKVETIFSKHLIIFQNPDIIIRNEDGDDSIPRILLTNSHDGFNSFQFRVGIYRLVCSNGLVIADSEFSHYKIRHAGYTFEELREVVTAALVDLPKRVQILNKMQERILTEEEKTTLAINALLLRNGIKAIGEKPLEFTKETIEEVLTPVRDLDKGNNLWKVFNVLQEKIIKGGYHSALVGSRVRKVKQIKSFEKDLRVNQELFKLATSII